VANAGGTFTVEQQAYCDLAHGKITWLRVLCSGFVPAAESDARAAIANHVGHSCRGIPRYRDDSPRAYNGFMTTTRDHSAASAVPQFARAGSFLEGLAAQDFAQLGGALAARARLRALLPSGLREWAGAEAITDQFARWFGDTEDFDLVEATVGEVGGRLHLHWRLRLRAQRLGAGWFTVEQHAYADIDDGGRIARLDLLCTGYRPKGDDG
jgi:hypothetical protein